MKRQTRPVVVEVKKRRGGVPGKRPIWEGIDLAAVANEVTPSAHDVVMPAQIPALDATEPGVPVSEGGDVRAQPAPTIAEREDPSAAVRFGAGDDVGPVPVELEENTQKRRRRSRRNWDIVSTLPRGQRWKRRLPAVLLRRTKRGD